MEEKLIITVSGKHMSGKSRLLFLLKKFLKEQNFDIEHDGGIDFGTEQKFDRHMNKNFDNVIEEIKNKTIVLEEKQLHRLYFEKED